MFLSFIWFSFFHFITLTFHAVCVGLCVSTHTDTHTHSSWEVEDSLHQPEAHIRVSVISLCEITQAWRKMTIFRHWCTFIKTAVFSSGEVTMPNDIPISTLRNHINVAEYHCKRSDFFILTHYCVLHECHVCPGICRVWVWWCSVFYWRQNWSYIRQTQHTIIVVDVPSENLC